jgi:hypothetical protein
MTYYQDLEPIDYFRVTSDVPLRSVGWLSKDFVFPRGEVSWDFFSKLCELTKNPWQPFLFRGFHVCELCQFKNYERTCKGTNNLFIPFNDVIYVAPEMILHYINEHHYLPPAVFIEAVMHCPDMQSIEYKILVEKWSKSFD